MNYHQNRLKILINFLIINHQITSFVSSLCFIIATNIIAMFQSSPQPPSQKQLQLEIAQIMPTFQTAMQTYTTNRKELQNLLAQLLKTYRTYKIHKNINRVISKHTPDMYFQFSLLNNITCCFSTKKQHQKACQYLKLADRELRALGELVHRSQMDYQSRKLQTIGVNLKMIRIKLQLCGVYALNMQHQQSLQQSSQAFKILQNIISSVCDYSMGQRHNEAFLQLQRCVTQPNTQISQKQIKNTYWNNVMNCQSDSQVRDIFINLFKNFHSSQHTQARSCLGKIVSSKQNHQQSINEESQKYLREFTIGSVMKITPFMLVDRSSRKQDFLNQRFLHQITIMLALAHFTVATQLRLSSMGEMDATQIQSFGDDDMSTMKKQKKMIQAQRHHFFGIQIIYKMAGTYVKDCPFFSRLVKGYQQVYLLKDNFQIIPQKVEEEDQTSLLSIKIKGSKFDYKQHQEYYVKKMKDKQSKCQTPRSHYKKQYKGQIRKKKQEETPRGNRKTPSVHKSPHIFLSPRHLSKNNGKSREKQFKSRQKELKTKVKGMDKTGLKSSKNDLQMRSPNKDYY